MSLIWATRGRNWGFRFLLDGGFEDPLLIYDEVFAGVGDEPRVWCRVADRVALRFPDPEGRRDVAGRVIPHEFVVLGDLAKEIDSIEVGLREIWTKVADEYAQIWDLPKPIMKDASLRPNRSS
jgi:hypothetical protein